MEYFGIALVVMFGTLFGLVLPLWLILHYWSKRRNLPAPSPDETVRLQRLAHTAERLGQRVTALEAILDNQSPGWRDQRGSRDYRENPLHTENHGHDR